MKKRAPLLVMSGLALVLLGCPPDGAPAVRTGPAWQEIPSTGGRPAAWRTRTPHGWLVETSSGGLTYVPDETSAWLPDNTPAPAEPSQSTEVEAPVTGPGRGR